jgi:UDPglucose--hexose-1-phosphate uridylyltransferase
MEVFASPTPFATHIFPLRHMASFGEITAAEIVDLGARSANLVGQDLRRTGEPDLNFTIRSGPSDYVGARHFHWYVSVIPRLTRVAGFELGSGMFINTVLPEAAAEFLRKVAVESSCRSHRFRRIGRNDGREIRNPEVENLETGN